MSVEKTYTKKELEDILDKILIKDLNDIDTLIKNNEKIFSIEDLKTINSLKEDFEKFINDQKTILQNKEYLKDEYKKISKSIASKKLETIGKIDNEINEILKKNVEIEDKKAKEMISNSTPATTATTATTVAPSTTPETTATVAPSTTVAPATTTVAPATTATTVAPATTVPTTIAPTVAPATTVATVAPATVATTAPATVATTTKADAKAKRKAVEEKVKNEINKESTELTKIETYLSDSQKDKDILISNKEELINNCKDKIKSAKDYLDELNKKINNLKIDDIIAIPLKIKKNHTEVIKELRNFKTKNNDFVLEKITDQIKDIIEKNNDTLELQVLDRKKDEYNKIFEKYNLITDEDFDNTKQAEYSKEISLIFKDIRNYEIYIKTTKIFKNEFNKMNIFLNDFEDPKNTKNTNENQKIIDENQKIINSLKDKSNVEELEKKNKNLQTKNKELQKEIQNLKKDINGFFNDLEQFKTYINTAVYFPATNNLKEKKTSYDYKTDYNTYKKNYEDSNIKLDKLVNNVKDVNDELIKINDELKKINYELKKAEKDKLVLNILNLVTNDMKEKEKQKKKDQDQEKLSQDSLLRKEFFEKEKLQRIEEEKLKKETLANKYNTIFLNSLKQERDEVNTKINAIDKELENPSIDSDYKIKLKKEKEELNIVLKKINKFLDDKPSILSNVSLPSLENITSLFGWFSNPSQKIQGSKEIPKPSTYIDLFLGNSILNPELNDLNVQDIRVVKQNNNPLYEAIRGVDTLFALNKLHANRKTLKSGIESEKGKTFKKRIKIEHNKQLSKREQELKNLYNKNNVKI